uniref:Mannosyltransferase n=1 Tax=Arion vulgaris TaxID=1028688 RepID=A0A0B7A8S6_9EUPU
MNKLATFLLCVNFITVLFPQPGYIHPDEFFQSSEIVAGDVLGVQHFRVWEFNGTSAVRNIVFPYLVLSPFLYLLQWINSTNISELHLSAVKVVMATRLPISFLSLLGYLATGRLADAFHVNKYVSTVLYCSSYVTWTYYTRTFSNSVESVLLAIVLQLVLIFSGTTGNYENKPLADDGKHKSKSGYTKEETIEKLQTNQQTPHIEDLQEAVAECKIKLNNTRLTPIKKKTIVKQPNSRNKLEFGKNCEETKKTESDGKTKKEISEKTNKKNSEKAVSEKSEKKVLETTGKEMEKAVPEKTGKEMSEKAVPEKSEGKISGDVNTDNKKDRLGNVERELIWKENIAELSHLRAIIVKLISFLLGAVVSAGFFNRPTFLVFALVPTIYWVWNVTRSDYRGRWNGVPLIVIIFNFSVGALFTFGTFVLLDTIYFNPEFLIVFSRFLKSCQDGQFSWHILQTGIEEVMSTFVVTPWNFIKYNSNSNNLAQHGLHPRYTHFLINLPLLLGPLFIPFIIVCIMSLVQLLNKSDNKTSKSNLAWMTFMALVPVLALSVFPHQEPRFLIPALPIFVVLGAKIVSAMTPGKVPFYALWALFNIILTLVYGYMHQAAMIPALSIYQQKLSSSSHLSKNHHAIFYKTYPPPRHLLLLRPENVNVSIHELAGAPIDTFLQTVKEVQSVCQNSQCQVYVFVPSTVTPQVLKYLPGKKINTTSICPHLSMEAPPRLWAWWKKRLSFEDMIMDMCLNIITLTYG